MTYDELLSRLYYTSAMCTEEQEDFELLLLNAAQAIEELQSTIVVVNIEENKDGVPVSK